MLLAVAITNTGFVFSCIQVRNEPKRRVRCRHPYVARAAEPLSISSFH
jgi:hypothetical protein